MGSVIVLVFLGITQVDTGSSDVTRSRDSVGSAPGMASVVADLVDLFPTAEAKHSSHASAEGKFSSGGVDLPGVFLHPPLEGEATLEFPPIELGSLSSDERLVLAFALGIRDGVPFDAKEGPRFDGVRFSVRADGETCFTEEVFDSGWKWRAVDFSHRAGTSVSLTLVTHCIETSNYDWALFGSPMLIRLSHGTWEPGTLVNVEGYDTAKGRIRIAGSEFLFAPHLELGIPYASRAIPQQGDTVDLMVPVRNAGRGHHGRKTKEMVQIRVIAEGDETDHTLQYQPVPELAPGAQAILKWEELAFDSAGKYLLKTDAQRQVSGTEGEGELYVAPRRDVGRDLGSSMRRITFLPGHDGRVAYARLTARSGDEGAWAALGTLFPLADIAVARRGGAKVHRRPVTFMESRRGLSRKTPVRLHGDLPPEGPEGRIELRVHLEQESGLFRFEVQATFEEAVDLYRLGGPRFAVGDGSFGADHDMVVFPGLEYFDSRDHSSSLLDAEYPVNLRRVPHPRKVTIPLISIQRGDVLAAMLWDPFEPWAGKERYLSAHLDVYPPERGFAYSEMSLFAPSVPDYVPEHGFEAEEPYPLEDGETARVTGWIHLEHRGNERRPPISDRGLEGEFGLAAVQKYLGKFGLPEPMDRRRSWEDEKALSRIAWFDTVWVPEERGWRHANARSWNPAPAPGYMLLLLLDAFDTEDTELRKEILNRIEEPRARAVEIYGPGAFSSGIHCHILRGESAFLLGNLLESIDRWKQEGESAIASQMENGGWGWHPNPARPKTLNLGAPGEQRSGTIAVYASRLLKLARVTGDQRFLDAGLRGLARMEEFRIPRGAQGWEVPLHCGDILAAGWAVRANVEAFRITGKERYLDQARYWAWTGIPFVYMWNHPDIPSMRYNTTAIFGATHFTHSWIGVPVVWCGLVYAYGLQELAQVDDSFAWRTVAEGITRSAEWQQYEADHPSAGCYPDSYNLMLNKRNPVDINPEDIMVNAFALEGMDPAIITHTAVFRGSPTLVSGVLFDLDPDPLTITSRLPPGAETYFYLTPVKDFESITYAGKSLEHSASLDDVPLGYRWDKEGERLEVKVTVQEGGTNRLEIR